MLRYLSTAVALKMFSLNGTTKKIYRKLGNTIGQRRRLKVKARRRKSYFDRGKLFRELCEQNMEIKPGSKFLEIGTGWFHWYALYLSLFHDINSTLFDIWDNRQLDVMKTYINNLKEHFQSCDEDYSQQIESIDQILQTGSFDELYKLRNMEYILETSGSLAQFADNSFDCIYSFHVMEHVKSYENNIKEMFRILKPGGLSIHQIGIDDHHTHYDKKESPKNYMRYSEFMWKYLFENDVQYINRLQMSDWLKLFEKYGYNFITKICENREIGGIKIQPKFQHYSQEDLNCIILTIVHQKPL
ncbi:MAG: SAM-dependent methyltransferase [Calditrichaeota bacterium]|nr:MAG: SAM-dependent methyltransferase [Calditrichota bacterium]